MGIGQARAIFDTIADKDWSDEERIEAIRIVMDMPTINSVTKDAMKEVILWLLDHRVTNITNCGNVTFDLRKMP